MEREMGDVIPLTDDRLAKLTQVQEDQRTLSAAVRDFCTKNPGFSGASLSVPLEPGKIALVDIRVLEGRNLGRPPVVS